MIKLNRPACPNPRALAARNYKHPDNKGALKDASFGKCMYCESKVSHIDFAHIEHIKPRAPNKFPELEFVWDNLGYCCGICNNNKSDNYDANTPYLDPYVDDPTLHLVFLGWHLFARNGSERGELTLRDIGLNRIDLIEQRKDRIDKLNQAILACSRTSNNALKAAARASLLEEGSPDKEYSYAAKCALAAHGIVP